MTPAPSAPSGTPPAPHPSAPGLPRPPAAPKGLKRFLNVDGLFLLALAIFFPLAVLSHFFFPGTQTFVFCCLALVPLARLMGSATEVLAHRLGAAWGGLLNASFGNAAELIIAIAALREGQTAVVKASITGAILGNLLLVLGMSVLIGGLKREKQTFNATAALSGSGMMFLAVTAMAVPDLFHLSRGDDAIPVLPAMSVAVAVVLLLVYVASLIFSLGTHRHLYQAEADAEDDLPTWSMRTAIIVLVLATVGVALVAEFLVHQLETAIASFGFTHTFLGVVVIAIVGNAAEHSTAVLMAIKNKMDLAFNIAFESSKQIALFVGPVLVLASFLLGHPLTLEFSHMEVVGMGIGVGAATLIALDGESNWLEGVMLSAVYAILGVAFYFIP